MGSKKLINIYYLSNGIGVISLNNFYFQIVNGQAKISPFKTCGKVGFQAINKSKNEADNL